MTASDCCNVSIIRWPLFATTSIFSSLMYRLVMGSCLIFIGLLPPGSDGPLDTIGDGCSDTVVSFQANRCSKSV
uniref:Putative secreted peptide n=1 Tax=Anopheles braziliensis TaxID=58242 RepID=A0A2M3ZWH4_9DIPT